MKPISIPVETALLTDFNSLDCLDGAVLSSFENERPLLGLLGQLDWRLSGEFTRLVRSGQITGKKNEHVYVPKNWNQKKIHLLVMGRGINDHPGERQDWSSRELESIHEQLKNLNLKSVLIEGKQNWHWRNSKS